MRQPFGDVYQFVATSDPAKDFSSQSPQPPGHGEPARKPLFNTVDTIAVSLALLCLILAILAVSPSLDYAARLQYTKQIIVIGFLLGVMNQCLQRVSQQLFLLVEMRFGRSTLQNYDGIVKWSIVSNQLSLIWRVVLLLLLLLPLGLGISYKRFTGGFGSMNVPLSGGFYAPTAPPGLQNVGPISIMVNATIPFMAASIDEQALPDFSAGTQTFGFNILLISNTSAAALDAPVTRLVSHLQQQLDPGTAYYLKAPVRGTVSHYDPTVETHRNDSAFWKKYYASNNFKTMDLPAWNGLEFGFLTQDSAGDNSPTAWNTSWSFLGVFPVPTDKTNATQMQDSFQQTALSFTTFRHQCRGTWKITRSSIELVSGDCDATPLPFKYQYIENCQQGLDQVFLPMLDEYLGPFGYTRNQSYWKLPTYSVVVASMYASKVAADLGKVGVQPAGPIWDAWVNYTDPYWFFNETYFVEHQTLSVEVPTLLATGALYLVLAIQPLLTVIAFIGAVAWYKMPIGSGFGMVSVLAGVDRDTLDLLQGAAFSGRVGKPIGLRVSVKGGNYGSTGTEKRIEYLVGERGFVGSTERGHRYG